MHQQQLILQAIAKTKENSALIAEASKVTLQEILHIDYSFRELVIRSGRHNYPVYDADVMLDASPTPDFEPDDIDVTETITPTWRIAKRGPYMELRPYAGAACKRIICPAPVQSFLFSKRKVGALAHVYRENRT